MITTSRGSCLQADTFNETNTCLHLSGELKLPKKFLVPPPKIDYPTGEFLAANGVSLYASAESQKIGHVSYCRELSHSFSHPKLEILEVLSSYLK